MEEELISLLATKYGLPKPIIIDIIYSQFRFFKEVVSKEQKNIMLPFWGKYAIKPGRRIFMDKINEKYGNKQLLRRAEYDKKAEDAKNRRLQELRDKAIENEIIKQEIERFNNETKEIQDSENI